MRLMTAVLVSGGTDFLVGAVVSGWLAAERLGSRAERQGDVLAALHHRWSVVEAKSPAWLHRFETWKPPPPWFPLQFLTLAKIAEGMDPERNGRRRRSS